MQKFIRLAGWGAAALAAMLLAVIAATSDHGQQRLVSALTGTSANGATDFSKAEAMAERAGMQTRLATLEEESNRLIEIARALSSDREQLLIRLSALERGLEDVTGSIRRQAAQPPPATEPPPKTLAALPPPTRPSPETPNRAAAPPGELEALQARPAAGVDVGSATSFDGLRSLWTVITATHPGLFDGLHPIVTVQENNRTRSPDLRLVIGPLTEVEPAKRICNALAAAKRYCRLVAFEGQPLALVAPEPPPVPRRPAAAAPQQQPAPKARPSVAPRP